jgi:hypothetical protein
LTSPPVYVANITNRVTSDTSATPEIVGPNSLQLGGATKPALAASSTTPW